MHYILLKIKVGTYGFHKGLLNFEEKVQKKSVFFKWKSFVALYMFTFTLDQFSVSLLNKKFNLKELYWAVVYKHLESAVRLIKLFRIDGNPCL